MAWPSSESATQLTLTSGYQTVQRSAADWQVTLLQGEMAVVTLNFNPESTPSENCDLIIPTTMDGTLYESDGEAIRRIISYDNRESDDPAVRQVHVTGVYGFKIRARVRDTDDTVGGTDTASTLDVNIRKDGIDLSA